MEQYYSPKETMSKWTKNCTDKIHLAPKKLFGKSILAGAMIAFGAAGSSVASHSINNVGLARLTAAVVFPVGLMMVILLGAELFTSDCMLVTGVADKKYRLGAVLRVLATVYLGNFLGAALLAFLVYTSGQLDYSDGALGAYTIKLALTKANLPFTRAFVSGILCNLLVCAAVLMATCAKDITGKLMASFFTIMLFVTHGFEHCVANMYYLTAGALAMCNTVYVEYAIDHYGFTTSQLQSLTLENILITNLVPVTLGNLLGGTILGLSLLYIYRERATELVTDKFMKKESDKNEHLVLFERNTAGAER